MYIFIVNTNKTFDNQLSSYKYTNTRLFNKQGKKSQTFIQNYSKLKSKKKNTEQKVEYNKIKYQYNREKINYC